MFDYNINLKYKILSIISFVNAVTDAVNVSSDQI